MRLIFYSLIMFLFSSNAFSVETGLATGNDLRVLHLEGRVDVRCRDAFDGGVDHALWDCYRPTLDPAEYTYFVTEPGGSADEVKLRAVYENGSAREKSVAFDPKKGRSKSRINLWIKTLFQTPLLEMGMNRVHFRLLKKGQLEREGEFQVVVKDGPGRYCPLGFLDSSNRNDCMFPSSVCDQYFAMYNWCE